MYQNDDACKSEAVSLINRVLTGLQTKLARLEPPDLQRPSIMKANLFDPGKMNVLPQDKGFVLSLLMSAVNEVNSNDKSHVMVTITKFGQKSFGPFDLGALIEPEGVQSLSLHVGCSISGVEPSIDLLWSRVGLQEVVGRRGTLLASCSFSESANFHSNLDTFPMDLSFRLNLVFRQEHCSINYVGLYSDTPQSMETTQVNHPISHVITACGLQNPIRTQMLLTNARQYLNHMQDMSNKFQCPIKARIDAVFRFTDHCPVYVSPEVFFAEEVLDTMLEGSPMIIPFKADESGQGLGKFLSCVTEQLVRRLREVFDQSAGLGGYRSSWTAYQYELALEQIFFGRSISPSSRPYSVSLGVCSLHPDSISTSRRFIGLAPVSSASVGEDPPPLDTWFKDKVQQQRVRRLFPFTEVLMAEPPVIGEQLVLILLKDIFQKDVVIDFFKGPQLPEGNLVDCRSVEELSKELVTRKGFGYPMTFARALEMLRFRGGDDIECLQAGLSKIKFLPKLTYCDESRQPKVNWNGKDYVELLHSSHSTLPEKEIAAFSGDILSNFEKMGLSSKANIRKYTEKGMPWIEACLERIPKTLSRDKKVLVLTYLSCVAFIQQNDYINYDKLDLLEKEMGFQLEVLKNWQVLSNLLLIYRPCVFRMPESIPYKVTISGILGKRSSPHPAQISEQQVEFQEEEEDLLKIEEEIVERVNGQTVPASEGAWWTLLELELLDPDMSVTHLEAYRSYVSHCNDRNLRIRSFTAFSKRRQRILDER